MRKLRVTFPLNLNDKDEALRGEVYWEEFKNVDIGKFEFAINECIKKILFFPKPFELHELIDQRNSEEYLEHHATRDEILKIEWIEPTEEGKRIAREFLQGLVNKWENDKKLKPCLEGKKAKEFEEKRKIAKEKVKLLK